MTDNETISTSPSPPAETKKPMSRGQKALLRITGYVAIILFLLPTVYVVKYYAFDRAGEAAAIASERAGNDVSKRQNAYRLPAVPTANDLPVIADYAQRAQYPADRINAISIVGYLLGDITTTLTHPIEAIEAKASLADIATHAPDPKVKAAAQDVLGKIAKDGVVLQR